MVVERIGAFESFESGVARKVEIAGRAVAIIRIDDDLYAIGDTCTHQDISLSEGDVSCEDRTVECWKHGSAFSLVTGEPESLPATKPVPVYDVRVVDGEVEVVISDG
jgi:3-phenylpropionate/trans-cinnamate dioxygenase ferredoxin subunit